MTWKIFALLSALASALGTVMLFRGSFAYEQAGGFYDTENFDISKGVARRNRGRQLVQRCGLGLLMAGFVLQVVAVALG